MAEHQVDHDAEYHARIEADNLVEQYLRDQLPAGERDRFEQHYLICATCLERVRWAEAFQLGMHEWAAETVQTTTGFLAWLAGLSRLRSGLLIAAMLLLMTLPWILVLQRQNPTTANQPLTEVALVYLDAERDAGPAEEEPTWRVSLDANAMILLSLQPVHPDQPRYTAQLIDEDGTQIWQGDALVPDREGLLRISLFTAALSPGIYRVEVTAHTADDRTLPAGTYRFRAL